MDLNFNKVEFILSAVSPKTFLRDRLPQIVFAGRSNVGKSSVINKLVGRKNFARVGAAPGKTTHINYFSLDKKAYLVDLPGYGYAKVSKTEKERWGRLMEEYFHDDDELITMGILIVDIRHAPSADDIIMHQWFLGSGCPCVVVANKHDKLKPKEVDACLQVVRETLGLASSDAIIAFSAEKGTGRQELVDVICRAYREACRLRGEEKAREGME